MLLEEIISATSAIPFSYLFALSFKADLVRWVALALDQIR
ncbi:MAG: hypothetical protein CM1200mP30_13330 [Pseudomonadota bacterium]|nr:MAG: hypothetical protein CM1200mP30_13330 [Pseudomonadota bacterium]